MLKPDYCFTSNCPLSKLGNGFSKPDGKGTSGVAIIGEALGHDEAIDGLPFRPKAQAGSKLEEIFRLVGVTREQFYLWNVIACQPPGNSLEGAWYEQSAIAHCSKHFNDAMSHFIPRSGRPKVILALGNVALSTLAGVSGLAHEKKSITFLRGFPLWQPQLGWIIPSFHPSFLKRGNPQFTPHLVADMRKALEIANGSYSDFPGMEEYKKVKYNEHPSLDDIQSFYYRIKENSRMVVSCDIETPMSADVEEDEREILDTLEGGKSEIIQIQFSYAKRTGIAIKFKEPYIGLIKKIFATENTKIGFNWWNFDSPRVRSNGIQVNGRIHDLMWMWKHWHPRLLRNLQAVASMMYFPFPWKHMFGSNLAWYGCADVDAPLWIYEKLPKMMKERGVWSGYEDMYKMHLILDKARDRGVPVSEEKRVILRGELQVRRDKLDLELQEDIPDEIKNITPRRKDKGTGVVDFGYIREPKEVRQLRDRYNEAVTKLQQSGRRYITFNRLVKKKLGLVVRRFEVVNRENGEREKVKRWCKLKPFKASKQQLVNYLRYKQRELLKDPDKKVEL